MFPRSFFPSSYWPRSYFPGGPEAPPPPAEPMGPLARLLWLVRHARRPLPSGPMGPLARLLWFLRAGASAGPLPTLFCDDPSFLAGLTTTAAVEFDANSDGSVTDAMGGPVLSWRPVPGLSPIACRVCPKVSRGTATGGREAVQTGLYVMFGANYALDRRYRLRVAGPRGTTRYVLIAGKVQDYFRLGTYHHSFVDATEYPL